MFDYAIDYIKQLKHKRSKTLNMKTMMADKDTDLQKVTTRDVKKIDSRIQKRQLTDPET